MVDIQTQTTKLARFMCLSELHQDFSRFFASADGLCVWHNVNGLFDSIGIPCISKEWRLFIVSASWILKGIVHQNGNRYPSIPLAHLMRLEENYTKVQTILIALKCDQFNWQIIRDFGMVAFLVDLQVNLQKFTMLPLPLG